MTDTNAHNVAVHNAIQQIAGGLDALLIAYGSANDPSVKLYAWNSLATTLTNVKALETSWRKDMFTAFFPGHQKGTKSLDIGNGYILKAVGKINYKVDPDVDKVDKVIAAIEKTGDAGKFLAERLLKTKIELGEGEYNKLDPNDKTQNKIKALVDSVLTSSDGTPSLEIVAPKTAA